MPNDLPPWAAVDPQTQRWREAGGFEALVDDLRVVLRRATGRPAEPSAAILDRPTLRSSPESGERAGYEGAKRKRGSKLHGAVDTLGHLLALHVTPANAEDRAEVGRLAEAMQEATGHGVELAYVDQGYTGERAEKAEGARDWPLSGQIARSPKGLCPPAPTMGGASQGTPPVKRDGGGWWRGSNVPLPGPRVFAASSRMTSATPVLSQTSISSLSSASCSQTQLDWWPVSNSLYA